MMFPPNRLPMVLLGLCLVAGGLASVRMGMDTNWDLRNYHLYAAHAWWHGLTFHHVAPAQMQSFFSPLPQLPAYALFTALDGTPRLYAFAMGLPAGACAFVLGRIALVHADGLGLPRAAAIVACLLVLVTAASGAAFVPAIGTSSGDLLVAFPLLLAYLLVAAAALRCDRGEDVHAARLALAGLLGGLAAGLKLTMAAFAAPLALMIACLLGWRATLAAAAGFASGFALGWGPFAWTLWRETANPFFPLFNDIFRSPDFLPIRLADERFLPRGTLQAVTYPFWWTVRRVGLVSELPMRDPRMALGYVGGLVLLGCAALSLRRPGLRLCRAEWLLLGVGSLGLAAWSHLFGIYRYLVVLEMLAPVLVMAALARAWPRAVLPGLACVAVLCLATTIRPNWGHARPGPRLLTMDALPPGPGALVLFAGDAPQAYLVPNLPADVVAVGIGTNLVRPDQEHGLQRRIRTAIAAASGEIWVVTEAGSPDERRDTLLAAYGLASQPECRLVRTSLDPQGHRFCPVRRLS